MASLIDNVLKHCLLQLAVERSEMVNTAACSYLINFIGNVAKHDLVDGVSWYVSSNGYGVYQQ